MWIPFVVYALSCSFMAAGSADTRSVSVVWSDSLHNYELYESDHMPAVAWATFDNSINTTGWSYLEVYTNGSYSDDQQAYAAGLAEGHITKDLIAMHWFNTYQGYCSEPLSAFCQRLQTYLNHNLEFVKEKLTSKGASDPYWHQVRLFYDQMSGLVDGYAGRPVVPPHYQIDVLAISLLQVSGDLEDLSEALKNPDHHRPRGSGSCSALIKLLPGNRDLYVAQDTWAGYQSMLRVMKKYDFAFHNTPGGRIVPGKVMTFSSYPGTLMSGDDFYIISSGLVSMETTIGNSNAKLWSYVQPTNAVLEGIRNMVANRLATTAAQWSQVFSAFNSGTYNNEWMIVDYKKFQAGSPLPEEGVLNVLEQIPGTIVSKDMTKLLKEQSYWPSYNIPFFPEIFNKSGGWDGVKKYGDWFTYNRCPRANIFRRDHAKVKDVTTMEKLMRYNDFTHDPLSRCNCTPPYSGENGISSRSDLNPAKGTYPFGALGHRCHGGFDMKLTTSSLATKLEMIAVSSPAYDDVPPFQWSKSDFASTVRHVGHPDLWVFKPEVHKWGTREEP